MPFRAAILLAAISWLCASPAFPQATASGVVTLQDNGGAAATGPTVSAGVLSGRPVLAAVRTSEPPRLDGRLDDPIWRTAARISEFFQQRPLEGAPATEKTEVYVAYDSEKSVLRHPRALFRPEVDPREPRRSRSDGPRRTVRVYIDPFLDQQRAYVFSVNGYGIQSDSVLRGTATGALAAALGAGMRRARSAAPAEWTCQRCSIGSSRRPRPRTTHPAAPTAAARRGRVMGRAVRLGGTIGRRRLDRGDGDSVQEPALSLARRGRGAPLGLSDRAHHRQQGRERRLGADLAKRDGHAAPDGCARRHDRTCRRAATSSCCRRSRRSAHGRSTPRPAPTRTWHQPEAAMNVKYGLTPNLTFDFTYNPDFSQIESDRAADQVNERFPVFYPELRPFFLEGQEIYQIAAPFPLAVVHTRSARRSAVRREAHGQGGQHVGRLPRRQRSRHRARWTIAAIPRSARPRRPFSAACATTSIQSRTSASSSPIANSSTATAGWAAWMACCGLARITGSASRR